MLTSPTHFRPAPLGIRVRDKNSSLCLEIRWQVVGHVVLPVGFSLVHSMAFTLSTSSRLGISSAAVMRAR